MASFLLSCLSPNLVPACLLHHWVGRAGQGCWGHVPWSHRTRPWWRDMLGACHRERLWAFYGHSAWGTCRYMSPQKQWVEWKKLGHAHLFATPWTVARQAPLSMGILQAKQPEWIAMPFSRGSSKPQGSNPGLPNCRRILYHLSYQCSLQMWSGRKQNSKHPFENFCQNPERQVLFPHTGYTK